MRNLRGHLLVVLMRICDSGTVQVLGLKIMRFVRVVMRNTQNWLLKHGGRVRYLRIHKMDIIHRSFMVILLIMMLLAFLLRLLLQLLPLTSNLNVHHAQWSLRYLSFIALRHVTEDICYGIWTLHSNTNACVTQPTVPTR